MLLVKVPQGVLDARQLYAFATVAETYARGVNAPCGFDSHLWHQPNPFEEK